MVAGKNTQDKFQDLISSVKWAYAKTMPEIPHEYIVIDDYPEKAEIIHKFIDLIDEKGHTKTFYGKEYKYLGINGYKYWVIENIINREKIL